MGNFSSVCQAVVSVVSVVAGIALCTVPFAVVFGVALVGAGLASGIASYSSNGNWSEWGKQFLVGLVWGAIGWGVGSLAGAIAPMLTSNILAQMLIRSTAASALTAASGSILNNLVAGRPWDEDFWRNLAKGAAVGLFTGVLSVVSGHVANYLHQQLEFRCSRLIEGFVGAVEHAVGWAVSSLIHTGEVDMNLVLVGAAMGGLGGALYKGTTRATRHSGKTDVGVGTVGTETTTVEEFSGQSLRRSTESRFKFVPKKVLLRMPSVRGIFGHNWVTNGVDKLLEPIAKVMDPRVLTPLSNAINSRMPDQVLLTYSSTGLELGIRQPAFRPLTQNYIPMPASPPTAGPEPVARSVCMPVVPGRQAENPRPEGAQQGYDGSHDDDSDGDDSDEDDSDDDDSDDGDVQTPNLLEGTADVEPVDPASAPAADADGGPPEASPADVDAAADAGGEPPEASPADVDPAADASGPAADAGGEPPEASPADVDPAADAGGPAADAGGEPPEASPADVDPAADAGGGPPQASPQASPADVDPAADAGGEPPEASPADVDAAADAGAEPVPLGEELVWPTVSEEIRFRERLVVPAAGSEHPAPDRSAQELLEVTAFSGASGSRSAAGAGSAGSAGHSGVGAARSGLPNPPATAASGQGHDGVAGGASSVPGFREVPVAQVHHLLYFNPEKDKYQFEWDEGLDLPCTVKVLGIIGPRGSGKTTFIHSLVYELGHVLLKNCTVASMGTGDGVWMYVLRDHELVILDCVPSTADAETPEGAAGDVSLLTDPAVVFTLLASCHIVLHTNHACTQTSTPQTIRQKLRAATAALASSSCAAGSWGRVPASTLTVVARGGIFDASERQPNAKDDVDVSSVCHAFSAQPKGLSERAAQLIRAAKGTAFKVPGDVSRAIQTAYRSRTVLPLSYLPRNDSSSSVHTAAYHRQLRAVTDHILQVTQPHWASESMHASVRTLAERPDSRVQLRGSLRLEHHWFALANEIQSEALQEHRTQEYLADKVYEMSSTDYGQVIKTWVDKVTQFLRKTTDEAVHREVKKVSDDIAALNKGQEGVNEGDRDPWHAFRIGLLLAKGLLLGSRQSVHHSGAVLLGLEGLCLMNFADSTFVGAWVRLAIYEYGILNLLVDVTHHAACWRFLRTAAEVEFRLDLLQWGFLTHADACLADRQLNLPAKLAALDALFAMMEPHPAEEIHEKGSVGEARLCSYYQALYHGKQLVDDACAGRGSVEVAKQRGMQVVEAFVQDNLQVKLSKPEERQEVTQGAVAGFSHQVAARVAAWCLESGARRLHLLLPQASDEESIQKAKLQVLYRLAAVRDMNLTKQLVGSNLVDWFAGYFASGQVHDLEVARLVALAAAGLIYAEDEVLRQERVWDTASSQPPGSGTGGVMTLNVLATRAEEKVLKRLGTCRQALLQRSAVRVVFGLLQRADPASSLEGRVMAGEAERSAFAGLLQHLLWLSSPEEPDWPFTDQSYGVLRAQLPKLLGSAFAALQVLTPAALVPPNAAVQAVRAAWEVVRLAGRVLAFSISEELRTARKLHPIDSWKFYGERLGQLLQDGGQPIFTPDRLQPLLAALNFGRGPQNLLMSVSSSQRATPGRQHLERLQRAFLDLRDGASLLLWNYQCCSNLSAGQVRRAEGEVTGLAELRDPQEAYSLEHLSERLGINGFQDTLEAARLDRLLAMVPEVPPWRPAWDVKAGWTDSFSAALQRAVEQRQLRERAAEELRAAERRFQRPDPKAQRALQLLAAQARAQAGGHNELAAREEAPRLACPTPGPAGSASDLACGAVEVDAAPVDAVERRRKVVASALAVLEQGGAARDCVKVLNRILRNVHKPEARRINLQGTAWTASVAPVRGAGRLLVLCGFCKDGDFLSYTATPENDGLCRAALGVLQ